jgi:hypothetical protein
MRPLVKWLAAATLALVARAGAVLAAPPEPEGRPEQAFDVMNWLHDRHAHDLRDERWNLYGQATWISSFKRPFDAPYTNLGGSPNSLLPDAEHSFTATATLYAGLALWRGAEASFVPEVISSRPLSGLHGLGSTIQNFELQKLGDVRPTIYVSRLYVRQTIDLGGAPVLRDSDPMQLGRTTSSRRLVLTAGNLSVLDVFDKNAYAGDLRRQFFNMAFLSYAAYDFAADARGYSWGVTGELVWNDWVVRAGRFAVPKEPNQLALDLDVWRRYGDQVEVEHAHQIAGRPGAVRVLAYRNRETMGRFDDAVAAWEADPAQNAAACDAAGLFNYGSANPTAPDLCWVRRPQTKIGVGVNVEQRLSRDVGAFLRAMYSDGGTEVYSYTSTDRSVAFGALVDGSAWRRERDVLGLGVGLGFISTDHARYLARGGVDAFIGDGALAHGVEAVAEAFYSAAMTSNAWISADFQLIANPAYNRDRGPVPIAGVRAHAEF